MLLAGCSERRADIARKDGFILIGNAKEPQALDPHLVSGVVEHRILMSLFEGLCADHPTRDDILSPGVAERWEANENFTVWTFYLRKDAQWSDGTPLTVADFLYSFERILTPEFGADYADLLYSIKGAEEFNKGETEDFSTVGVSAVDDHTLRVELTASVAFLPQMTKHFTWFPVPKHVIEKYGSMTSRHTDWTKPGNLVSNGAFLLAKWQYNYMIEVKKNPHYWDADTVRLNGIRFYAIINPYTETRAFLAGQLHVTSDVPPSLLEKMRADGAPELNVDNYLSTSFYRANVTRPPLDNKNVRLALSHAINQSAICENILRCGEKPAYALTPVFSGYQPPNKVFFDPKKAAQYLAIAGYPDGKNFPILKILVPSTSNTAGAVAESVQAMWKQHLGINIEIQKREWSTYLNAMSNLDYDIAGSGWTGDYIDPSTFLDMWTEGNGNNRTGWSSSEYERLLQQALEQTDLAARFAILAKAEGILLDERAIMPISWNVSKYLKSTTVKGWHPSLLNNHPYKFIYFE